MAYLPPLGRGRPHGWLTPAERLLGVCLIVTVAAAIGFYRPSEVTEEAVALVALLAVAGVALGTTSVRLDAGVLTLGAIPVLVAVATMPPVSASVVAVAANASRTVANRRLYRVPQFATSTAWASLGATVRIMMEGQGVPQLAASLSGIGVAIVLNLTLTVLLLYANGEAPFGPLIHRALSTSILLAYGAFALTAGLCASLLRPTVDAVVQVGSILLLSTFVIRSLGHQQSVERLAHQLADAEERATFGHAMEAVLHRLKNLVSVASANLVEAVETPEAARLYLDRARRAVDEAGDVLRQAGVDGRALFEPRFQRLLLLSFCRELVDEVQPLGRRASVSIQLTDRQDEQVVSGDPGLLRDLLLNLLRNAIDHAGTGGHVVVTCGSRDNGWPFVEVKDDGPGVPVSALDTLFVGRASDSTSGAGLGLVASYLIAREHYGKLFYQGGRRRGAVFTLVLPPQLELERRLGHQHLPA